MPPRILPVKRQVTVYDKSALKVRINGRRISTPDPELSKAQAKADAEAKHIRPMVRTSKGKNWIAPDVYDFERIPERRDYALDDDGDETEIEASTLHEKGKKRARPEPKTYDGKRRRLNNNDLSFISNPYASYTAVSEPSTILDPSTDLLKTIHYFTSKFYDASGQLANSTRKTVSRKQKESQQSEEPDSGDEKSVEDDEGTDANRDDQEDDSESDSYKPDQDSSSSDNDDPDNSLLNKRRKSRRNQTKQRHLQKIQEDKDMYTAFDGSALFCIGMLLKAHIISKLESSMPESWDGEVDAYKELEEDLHLRNSDRGSEEEEGEGEENLDDTDAEKQDSRKEKYKRWENETLSSSGRIDDLKVDFVSPEYSRL